MQLTAHFIDVRSTAADPEGMCWFLRYLPQTLATSIHWCMDSTDLWFHGFINVAIHCIILKTFVAISSHQNRENGFQNEPKLLSGYSAPRQKIRQNVTQNRAKWLCGAPWAGLGGHGGSRWAPRLIFWWFRCLFGVPLGGPLETFLFFFVGYFKAISNMFPEGLFDGSASLLGTIWHNFCHFLVVLGSGENSVPACTGAMFWVFWGIRNWSFSGIAFYSNLGEHFYDFGGSFGVHLGTLGATLGTLGQLFCRVIFRYILGA